MITKANAAGGLGITLQDMSSFGGNGADRPATGISWYEAARFVNWLNTDSGSTPAYKFDGGGNFQLWQSGDAGYNPDNLYRNSQARYFLPSTDEWYKAAYYNADTGTYGDYPPPMVLFLRQSAVARQPTQLCLVSQPPVLLTSRRLAD